MNEVENFFDSVAVTWDERESHTDQEKLSLLDKVGIKKTDKVLDMACGTGVITALLHNFTDELITGIDISANMIEIAKEKYKNDDKTLFIHTDFMNMDENNKFDTIIIYNAYPHFLSPVMLAYKLSKMLNPNGKFAILHSLSRFELEKHHSGKANSVSRVIDEPKKEYKFFKDSFDLVEASETEHTFVLICKKKC